MTIKLRFVRQQHEAENAQSFFFEPESALHFQAGQYLRYTLPHPDPDARGTSRYFTIASAPSEPHVRLTTRLSTLSSTFKQMLTSLAPGAVLEASGPHGQFVYSATDAPAVFIAGGIGITPFRSILGDLATRLSKPRARTTLLYSNSSSDIPFHPFFDSLMPDWPELHVVYTVTRPSPEWQGLTGRIDAEFIRQHVPDASQQLYLVCGPTAMVDGMHATLAEIGADASRIKYEGFPGYDSARGSMALVGR